MTLEEVARLCPVPDGWREWSAVYPHMWSTGSSALRAVVFVEVNVIGLRVRAFTDAEDHYINTSEASLPAAYARALRAVGLTKDKEALEKTRDPVKESLRRESAETRAQLAAVLQLPGVVDKVEFRLSDLNDTLASLAAARASGPQVDALMAEHRRLEGALKATGQPGWR